MFPEIKGEEVLIGYIMQQVHIPQLKRISIM